MGMKITCDECGQSFAQTDVDMKKMVVKRDNKEHMLVYYECPKCNVKFIVVVEDEDSIHVHRQYMAYKNQIAQKKKVGQYVSLTLQKKMRDTQMKWERQTKAMSFLFPKTFYQFEELKLENIEKRTDANIG